MRLLMRRSFLLGAAAIGLTTTLARAQHFPTRPIILVVPFAPGGPTDVVGRIIAQSMSHTLGQQVIVENVAGAGGTSGMTRVARADPDGYTIGLGSMGTQAAAQGLYPNLAYDPASSFDQLGLVNFTPVLVAARKGFPARDFSEFVSLVRKQGSKPTHGHAGVGSAAHAAAILFNDRLGLKPTLVPYRGTGPALTDLVSEKIDYLTDQALNLVPQVQGGAIRAYAVAAPQRLSVLKDVPTIKELGTDFVFSNWNALVAPAKLPPAVRDALARSLARALEDPQVVNRLEELASTVPEKGDRGPAALQRHVEAEVARVVPLLKEHAGK